MLLLSLLFFFFFRPNAFSWDQVLRLSPVERLDHAFTVAKEQLAIERLLDAEGTDMLSKSQSFPTLHRYLFGQE